jgi:bacterioferritin (cytochrome b1)
VNLTDRELAENSSFLVWLKTAAYAPPDTTGALEGKFNAPVAKVISAIKDIIQNELKTGFAYHFYGNNLRGQSHHSIAEEFEDHAADEAEHAEYLMRRLSVIAGPVQLEDVPAPPPASSPEQIIDTMIRIEQEGIAKWRLLLSLLGDDNPMHIKVEEYLSNEQEHLDELMQLRPTKQASDDPNVDSTDNPYSEKLRKYVQDHPAVLTQTDSNQEKVKEDARKGLRTSSLAHGLSNAVLAGTAAATLLPAYNLNKNVHHILGKPGTLAEAAQKATMGWLHSLDPMKQPTPQGAVDEMHRIAKDIQDRSKAKPKHIAAAAALAAGATYLNHLRNKSKLESTLSVDAPEKEHELHMNPGLLNPMGGAIVAQLGLLRSGINQMEQGRSATGLATVAGSIPLMIGAGGEIQKNLNAQTHRDRAIAAINEKIRASAPGEKMADDVQAQLDALRRGGANLQIEGEGYAADSPEENAKRLRSLLVGKNVVKGVRNAAIGAIAAHHLAGRKPGDLTSTLIGGATGAGVSALGHLYDKHTMEAALRHEAPKGMDGEVLELHGVESPGLLRKALGAGAAVAGIREGHAPASILAGFADMRAGAMGKEHSARLALHKARSQRHIFGQEAERMKAEELLALANEKVGAYGMPEPAIPTMLTPGRESSGGEAAIPGFGTGQPQEQLVPPQGFMREQLDPEMIAQLEREQAARAQESEAAAAYLQGQAQQSQQQADQLQQQLEQMQQQLEQQAQQMQEMEQQKQMAEQAAQQASSTATQALQSQLQTQQDALSSRQMTTSVLQESDSLRQKLREIADPPPPPPPLGAPMDPLAGGGAAPPQGAPPPGQGAPPPAEAPKTAALEQKRVFQNIVGEAFTGKDLATNIGLPAAAAAAAAAAAYVGNTKYAPKMIQGAQERLQKAETKLKEEQSYRNEMGVISAKAQLMGTEVATKYPKQVAAASVIPAFMATRSGIETFREKILPHLRQIVSDSKPRV